MDTTALVHILNAVSDRAASIAVAALWQGALVAGALTLCLRFAPRVSAAYRFAAWATAFVALVGLSAFSLMPQFSNGAANAIAMHSAENIARPWFSVDARWSLAIAALWLAASLFRAADLAVHSLRLRKLWKDAKPVQVDERVEGLLAAAAAECGRGRVEVCTTDVLQRPSVIGFLKPRILIPDWLFGRLTQGELEQIVLHEAEHLRRRDDWTNLAQKLCLVLFPLNPALIWIERRLCREREMACDDGVIRVTRAPRAYAACLASLAERGLERQVEALSLGAWQRRPELVHRVHSILRGKGGLSPMGARIMLGTLGCGLLAGSVELAQSPQLVAFVPARNLVAASNVEAPKITTAAKSVPAEIATVAHEKKLAPKNHIATANPVTDSGTPTAMNVTLRQSTKSETPALPVKANVEPRKTPNAPEQQWIVLTAWEQVDTSNQAAGLVSDYETGARSAASDGLVDPQRQDSRITITQLMFKIVPEGGGSNTAAKPAASPSASQPRFAIRDGWLVLQL